MREVKRGRKGGKEEERMKVERKEENKGVGLGLSCKYRHTLNVMET